SALHLSLLADLQLARRRSALLDGGPWLHLLRLGALVQGRPEGCACPAPGCPARRLRRLQLLEREARRFRLYAADKQSLRLPGRAGVAERQSHHREGYVEIGASRTGR